MALPSRSALICKAYMHSSLCSESVIIISRWCEVASRYEQGRVSHAVAGCMRSLLQDWHLMVTQLEHQLLTGHLTLQVSIGLLLLHLSV